MTVQKKTLAMKLLEGKHVAYEAVSYPEDLREAEMIAGELGVPAGQVFKTLVVVRPPAKPLLVMIPADRQLNLKKLAKAVEARKLQMATHREAEELTGLQVGGISALALLNKRFVLFLDTAAQAYEQIYISAGQRGLDIRLAVDDLVKVTRARFVDASD